MATETMFEVLDEAECRRLLAGQEVGRVAFVGGDGFPVVLPVNYVVDGDVVALRTESGAKADYLPLHRVAFEVDGFERWNESGWSVLVQGYGQEVTDAVGERFEDLRRRRFVTWVPGQKDRWLTIDIHRLSGRRIVPATGRVTGSAWGGQES